jgi:hypothetical protein
MNTHAEDYIVEVFSLNNGVFELLVVTNSEMHTLANVDGRSNFKMNIHFA